RHRPGSLGPGLHLVNNGVRLRPGRELPGIPVLLRPAARPDLGPIADLAAEICDAYQGHSTSPVRNPPSRSHPLPGPARPAPRGQTGGPWPAGSPAAPRSGPRLSRAATAAPLLRAPRPAAGPADRLPATQRHWLNPWRTR